MRASIWCALVLAATLAPGTAGVSISSALDIISVGKDVVVAIAKAWKIVDKHMDYSDAPTPYIEKTEAKLFKKMDLMQVKVEWLANRIDVAGTQTITTVLKTLPHR